MRANRVFLLHNGRSLSDLFVRLSRDKFCNLLSRFWDRFSNDWDVLLHGSPAVDFFSGIKLSAGGELGIGVGEEEWGSGEREVLEGLVNSTDGLLDIVVARFGEPSKSFGSIHTARDGLSSSGRSDTSNNFGPWLGSANFSQPSDGVIFTGSNRIARQSLDEVADWMSWIYAYGESAYGVKDNPSSGTRRARPQLARAAKTTTSDRMSQITVIKKSSERSSSYRSAQSPGIPPPIVSAAEQSLDDATQAADKQIGKSSTKPVTEEKSSGISWTKILTLGLAGSEPTTDKSEPKKVEPEAKPKTQRQVSKASLDSTEDMQEVDPMPDVDEQAEKIHNQIQQESHGYFLVGLKGPLEDVTSGDEEDEGRILLRTMFVEVSTPPTPGEDLETPTPQSIPRSGPVEPKKARLRILVYVQRPFIYTFLFKQRTDSLQLKSFYRDLHKSLSNLHRPLNQSTSPDRVAQRLSTAGLPFSISATTQIADEPIYHLIYDPQSLSIHSNVPSIPYPGTLAAEGLSGLPSIAGWTRPDALNVHSAIIESVAHARRNGNFDVNLKTSRGWWIVYMKLGVEDTSNLETPRPAPASSQLSQAFVQDTNPLDPNPNTSNDLSKERSTNPVSTAPIVPSASTISPRLIRSPSEYPHSTIQSPDLHNSSYFPHTSMGALKPEPQLYREAILVRRARDSISSSGKSESRSTSGGGGLWSFGSVVGKDANSGWGPARLAEGVGVDAKKYVEGLIGLGR